MRRTKEEAMKTRESVLKAATQIIIRLGIGAFTIEAVAQEAGVTKGGVLHHFPSKEALIDSLIDDVTELFNLRLTAELAFKRIRYEAGVKRTDGFYYQPRLHDFRHTFAVRRLVTWYREGKNVQRLLPHLATYLGHVSIRETSRYLTMTKELLDEASHRFELYATLGGKQ